MFFKKKRKQTETQPVIQADSKSKIQKIEEALSKPQKNEDRISLLNAAAFAYENGEFGATQNLKKAAEYYQKGDEMGDLGCRCNYGRLLIMNQEGDDMLFSIGIVKVCDCYKQGHVPAKDILQLILDAQLFPNCQTIEDLISLAESV